MTEAKRYSVQDVGRLVGLTDAQVRDFARAGNLGHREPSGRAWRFAFQDLVLLRAIKGLASGKLPHRKILRVLARLRQQVPEDRPLSTVQIELVGDEVVARSSGSVWIPESGQARFDFREEGARALTTLDKPSAFAVEKAEPPDMGAEDWFDVGEELASIAPEEAREAFRRALELSPVHARAHVALARLLRVAGELRAAELHCRVALEETPAEPAPFLQLGLCLEAQGRLDAATEALEMAVRLGSRARVTYDALTRVATARGRRGEAEQWRRAKRELRASPPSPDEEDSA